MFKAVFSGFSVDDLEKAKDFYSKTLGLEVTEEKGMGMKLHLPGGGIIFVYPKDNHQPASYTMLNLVVDDINKAVDDLKGNGVNFEHYEGFNQDKKGIAKGLPDGSQGPSIAWFKDPAGNIISVLEDPNK